MILIEYQYNQFSEVNQLNENFLPDVNKLKLTIDAVSPLIVYKKAYPIIVKQFQQLFPNIHRHQCCQQQFSGVIQTSQSITGLQNFTLDTIHFIEHIIIDMQCSMSKMKICSGITCNYHHPSNRYDIFVECLDRKVGFHAANIAIDMVQRVLNNDRLWGSMDMYFNSTTSKQHLLTPASVTHTAQQQGYPDFLKSDLFHIENLMKN